jgi:hypothetical protein
VALEAAHRRIEAARSGLSAAETQLYAEQERFNVGLSTNFLVLTRQNELTVARVTLTEALTAYRQAGHGARAGDGNASRRAGRSPSRGRRRRSPSGQARPDAGRRGDARPGDEPPADRAGFSRRDSAERA